MKLSPYWWTIDAAPPPSDNTLPGEADVVIIGGGFTGLSAGLTMRRQGERSVVILDAGEPGRGASTRNGGICSGHIRIPHTQLGDQYGKPFADKVYSEGIEARANLFDFCQDEQIDCQLNQSGHFTGAMSARAYDSLARQAQALNAIPGHDIDIIPKGRQHEEISTDRFHGGLLRREIGGYHPAKFYKGLRSVVEGAGIKVMPHTSAQMILDDTSAPNPKAKRITTSRGEIKAGQVIVATNGYNELEKSFGHFIKKRIVPVQSCIIVTEPLGQERVKELLPGMRMYGNTDRVSAYFRPVPDEDRILLGARSFDRKTPGRHTYNFVRSKLIDILPQLQNVKIDYCWLGNVAFNRRYLPGIFQADGIYYASGYAGSGTVWAYWLGKKVAEMALDLDVGKSAFYNTPPKPIPLYYGNPWFMPYVIGFNAAIDKVNQWSSR